MTEDNTGVYKVLVGGASAHGGTLDWSLPTPDPSGDWRPGEWHRVVPPVRAGDVCQRGLHLTTDPMQWPKIGMQVYDAEGEGPSDTQGDKTAFTGARLLRPSAYVIPDYWRAVERFVTDEIPAVPWFQPDGAPDESWHLTLADGWDAARAAARDEARVAAWFAAWAAARDAAWAAARDAAWDAARVAARVAVSDAAGVAVSDAARDAALYAPCVLICDGLSVEQRHVDYAIARWRVWQKGYALYGDVDGVLHVYGTGAPR